MFKPLLQSRSSGSLLVIAGNIRNSSRLSPLLAGGTKGGVQVPPISYKTIYKQIILLNNYAYQGDLERKLSIKFVIF